MRIVVGSDERTAVTDALVADLEQRGHDLLLIGPLAGGDEPWTDVGYTVGRMVADGAAEQGVVCCYTGTGVSIAANKVRGVRAALCHDAQTASGARRWNDANVLALSLRTTTTDLAREILDAWFAGAFPESERAAIERLRAFEQEH